VRALRIYEGTTETRRLTIAGELLNRTVPLQFANRPLGQRPELGVAVPPELGDSGMAPWPSAIRLIVRRSPLTSFSSSGRSLGRGVPAAGWFHCSPDDREVCRLSGCTGNTGYANPNTLLPHRAAVRFFEQARAAGQADWYIDVHRNPASRSRASTPFQQFLLARDLKEGCGRFASAFIRES
jgi:hypothetical protein